MVSSYSPLPKSVLSTFCARCLFLSKESEPLPKPVYSTVTQGYSLRCMEAINRMETLIREDPGQRGIAALARCTELWRASLDLYKANTVVLTTGMLFHIYSRTEAKEIADIGS